MPDINTPTDIKHIPVNNSHIEYSGSSLHKYLLGNRRELIGNRTDSSDRNLNTSSSVVGSTRTILPYNSQHSNLHYKSSQINNEHSTNQSNMDDDIIQISDNHARNNTGIPRSLFQRKHSNLSSTGETIDVTTSKVSVKPANQVDIESNKDPAFDSNVDLDVNVSESITKHSIQSNSTNFKRVKQSSEASNSIEDKWRDLEKTFRLYTDSVMKKALPKILRIHSQLRLSSQCNSALLQLVSGLRKFKSWAVKSK